MTLLFSNASYAAGSNLHIRSANLIGFEGDVLLNADAEINLSPELEKALLKGFTLSFVIEFQLILPKKYWFNDEIAFSSHQVDLNYHALTRQYTLIRGDQQRNYATLDEAIEDLSIIQDLKVFEKAVLEKNEPYQAVLMMRVDHKKLPKALRVEDSNDWKLSSQVFEWIPNPIK